jgi:SET domain-containing protein 6
MAAGEKRKASSSNAPQRASRGSESDARKRPNETKHKTAAAAADDLATDHSPSELAYLSWLRSAGVRLSGVTIGRFPNTGRGCVATRDLHVGDVVVEVPEDAILTADNSVAADALRDFFGGDTAPRLEREALVLAVMAEMARGEASRVNAYLNALPSLRATHSPLGWTADELAELEGTSCAERMFAEDEDAELPSMTVEHWKHVAEPFFERHPEFAMHPSPGSDENETTYLRKAYLHATALVAGFSFTLGEEDEEDEDEALCRPADAADDARGSDSEAHASTQAMVPFWDMLNHVSPELASVRLEHDERAASLKMVCVREVRRGSEVFNTYGALGDDELLRRYGFVARANPHGGGAEVTLRELVAAAAKARFVVQGTYDDDASEDGSESESDDFEPPAKAPPTSDSDSDSEEDDAADADEDSESESADETIDPDGSLSVRETTERLRLLRRFGVASRSTDRFAISRTGKPSLALRAAARVLAMHASQFRQLAAADAFERGEKNDQSGIWSDSDDEGAFAGLAPATTERVWDGPSADSDDEGARFFFSSSFRSLQLVAFRFFLLARRARPVRERPGRAFRDGRRVIMTPLWDLLGTEKFP